MYCIIRALFAAGEIELSEYMAGYWMLLSADKDLIVLASSLVLNEAYLLS